MNEVSPRRENRPGEGAIGGDSGRSTRVGGVSPQGRSGTSAKENLTGGKKLDRVVFRVRFSSS